MTHIYRIESKAGVIFGQWRGETASDAFKRMLEEAGDSRAYGESETAGTEADWIIYPLTTATDFRITGGSGEGTLSDDERQAAIRAAQAVLDAGGTYEEADIAAHKAAFAGWARMPETAELVVG